LRQQDVADGMHSPVRGARKTARIIDVRLPRHNREKPEKLLL
jgi:hypothetical protein